MTDRFSDPKHIAWAKAVKAKHDYTCAICETSKGWLHSHHLNSYDIFIKQRFDVNNGVCLCQKCHNMFHDIYGRGKNTKYQFEEFQTSIKLIKLAVQRKKDDSNT